MLEDICFQSTIPDQTQAAFEPMSRRKNMEGRTTESMKDVQRTVASLGGGANERNANHRLDDVEEEEAVSRAPQSKRARHVNVRLHELSRNFCEMIKVRVQKFNFLT